VIPYTDYERLALLEELERGEKIILPISENHAYEMIYVAAKYIQDRKNETWVALTKEYK